MGILRERHMTLMSQTEASAAMAHPLFEGPAVTPSLQPEASGTWLQSRGLLEGGQQTYMKQRRHRPWPSRAAGRVEGVQSPGAQCPLAPRTCVPLLLLYLPPFPAPPALPILGEHPSCPSLPSSPGPALPQAGRPGGMNHWKQMVCASPQSALLWQRGPLRPHI